jgi:hypothetical protein
MYHHRRHFLAANPLKRYTLSSRSRFKRNQDGSVDLYLQNESSCKDREANWLPAPTGKFILMLRRYWPQEPPQVSVLDGSWKPPPVRAVQ